MGSKYLVGTALVVILAVYGCGKRTPTVSKEHVTSSSQGNVGVDTDFALGKLASSSLSLIHRANLVVTVTLEGEGLGGLEVDLSRSISGRVADYRWRGQTDEEGRAQIGIAVDKTGQFWRAGASGYYLARARDLSTGETVGRWGSIPIADGTVVTLSLPIGERAGRTSPDSRIQSGSPYSGSYTIINNTTGTEVMVRVGDGVRHITANGLPDHETGPFPNLGNPNSIGVQSYEYTFPLHPQIASEPTSYNIPQPFGIAINGVHLDPYAAEWFNNDPTSGWQLAALANQLGIDAHNAHVQPNGAYHYHGPPMALLTGVDRPDLIGFAGDGFPIYGPHGFKDPWDLSSELIELTSSYRLKEGTRQSGPGGIFDGIYVEDYEFVVGEGDLDECNGRTGVTSEFPDGTYYYVATNTWPFLGRCFAGTLTESFTIAGPGGFPPVGGPPPPGGRPSPPR